MVEGSGGEWQDEQEVSASAGNGIEHGAINGVERIGGSSQEFEADDVARRQDGVAGSGRCVFRLQPGLQGWLIQAAMYGSPLSWPHQLTIGIPERYIHTPGIQ